MRACNADSAGRAERAQQNTYFDATKAAYAARGSPRSGERNKIGVLMRPRGSGPCRVRPSYGGRRSLWLESREATAARAYDYPAGGPEGGGVARR